jgi:hypothetical protein
MLCKAVIPAVISVKSAPETNNAARSAAAMGTVYLHFSVVLDAVDILVFQTTFFLCQRSPDQTHPLRSNTACLV